MSYFNINKLCNYLDQRGTDGAPTESGWYVLEADESGFGIGFFAKDRNEVKFISLYPTDRLEHDNQRGELRVVLYEQSLLSACHSRGILRFAPLRFDLKD